MKTTTNVAAVVAFILTTAASAAAQIGWSGPPDLLSTPQSTGGAIYAPRVGVDAAGNAVALWTEPGPTPFGTGPTVRTARFDIRARRWSNPQTLSTDRSSTSIDIAVDAAGNALALWRANPISVTNQLHATRYEVATGLWSEVPFATTAFLTNAAIDMNRNGDAVLCWNGNGGPGLGCRRYSAATASWGAEEVAGNGAGGLDVAIDGAGNVHAVWSSATGIQTSRFDAASTTWGPPTDLATGLPTPPAPAAQLAMNEAGDAVVAWSRGSVLEAARRPAGSGTWTTATALSLDGLYNETARPVVAPDGAITTTWVHTGATSRTIQVARYDPVTAAWGLAADLPGQGTSAYGPAAIDVDAQGNVHVVWSQSLVSPLIRLLAARYAVSTGRWTTVTNLSAVDQAAYNSDVAIDASGSAMAVWFQQASGVSTPQAMRWDATPVAPVVVAVAPSPLALVVDLAGRAASPDPALAPSNLEYSLDGGATWNPRMPASVSSPFTVPTPADGITYALRLRAVSSAGPSRLSDPLAVRSGPSGSPSPLRVVSVVGNAVTLAWAVPRAGLDATDYVLEGGLAPGATLASVRLGTATSMATLTVPSGVFYLRVIAANGVVRGGASNDVRVAVGSNEAPSRPTGLLGLVNGPNLALSWTNTVNGGVPTRVLLTVSGPVSGALPLPLAETFSFASVPAGTYTFTVAAVNAAGTSAPSAPVTLTFPGTCSGAPNAPVSASGTISGSLVSLAWEAPASGPAVTGYELSVTGAFAGRVPVSGRAISGVVGAGRYDIAVAAVNGCGSSTSTVIGTFVMP